MNHHDKMRQRRIRSAAFDREERARRRAEEAVPTPTPLPEAAGLTDAETAEAEANRLSRLPWWERRTADEKAADEAARKLSRYLST